MTIPDNPPPPIPPPMPPSRSPAASGADPYEPTFGTNPQLTDPTGAWQKFLSQSGTPATPQDVARFFNTLLSFFNLMIKQADDAHKRQMEQQKETMNDV